MNKTPSLLFCISMDAIGMATYFIPFFGEWADVLWAPLSAYILYRTFQNNTGKVAAVINLLEELLPFLDFIPTFTLNYLYNKHLSRKNL